jgi:hypothetical protein
MSARWEVPVTVAMIALAAAAIAVAGRLVPSPVQTITVHFDGPLVVRSP